MRKVFTTLTVAALTVAALTACGGGGSSYPEQPKYTDLVVLGNSITRHPPLASIGWSGDWGMAASAQDKDFAHRVGAALGVPVSASNVSRVTEVDPTAELPQVTLGARTAVVVELGDNGLPAKYGELLASLKGASKLVCTSTYWQKNDRDQVMKPLCEAAGGTWVYIGNIYRGAQGSWTNYDVANHPGDVEMALIAERIVQALKE
jgi:hypothetical protein